MSGSTLTGETIGSLPLASGGTLSASLAFPVEDPNGGGPGVPKTSKLLGSAFVFTELSIGGTVIGTAVLDPAKFALASGTLTVNAASGLSLGGTTVTTLDTTFFSQSAGTLTLQTEAESALPTAGSVTGAMQQIIFDNGVAKLATIAQIAGEEAVLTLPAVNLSSIGSQVTGQPFAIAGSLANFLVGPNLSYSDDGGALAPLPTGSAVNSSSFNFTHPGLATGTHVVKVEDAEGYSATGTFTVGLATVTAAVLSNIPASGVSGQAISGVTVALTPSYATAYAVLNTAGADEGARQAFTGTAVPSLTPASFGTYQIDIYAASTGGTAVSTSGTFTVAAQAATAATLGSLPSKGVTGTAITGVTDTLTPANAFAYAVLSVNGADEGTRQAFSGTSLPSLTPAGVGSYEILIYATATGGAPLATSAAFPVTTTPTAATIAGVPASGVAGQPITGLTDTLTPANATGWVTLFTNGTGEGQRQALTGTSIPSLTPLGGGNYLVKIFPLQYGGTALATSAVIAVTIAATAASMTGVPATGSAGTAISGVTASLTPTTATAYAVLALGGVEQGARVAFVAGTLPNFTPASPGSYTLEIFSAATAGTALATSSTIAVGAAPVPQISGVSAMATLDASAAGNVTSDAALNSPQGTNGGTVQGWKDGTGGGNNFTGGSNAQGTLATAVQNGLNAIAFGAGGSSFLNGASGLVTALQSDFTNTSGAGLTIALVLKYNGSFNNDVLLTFDDGGGNGIQIKANSGGILLGGNAGIVYSAPAVGALVKLVATFSPSTGIAGFYVNALTPTNSDPATGSYTPASGHTINRAILGNCYQDGSAPTYEFMELDIWPTVAAGVGGASPTGDIATVMSYLTSKWGS